ncbi:hypothetical protein ACJX0J_013551, partial [Zea mays]
MTSSTGLRKRHKLMLLPIMNSTYLLWGGLDEVPQDEGAYHNPIEIFIWDKTPVKYKTMYICDAQLHHAHAREKMQQAILAEFMEDSSKIYFQDEESIHAKCCHKLKARTWANNITLGQLTSTGSAMNITKYHNKTANMLRYSYPSLTMVLDREPDIPQIR